jgi:hypothetical protein
MSKFSKLVAERGDDAPVGTLIDGSFGCQVCHEQVDEAKYYVRERVLLWRCSQKHESFIEEFML